MGPTPTMPTMKKSILTFCAFLCLFSLCFSWTALLPEPTSVAQSVPAAPKPRVLSSSQPNPQKAPEPRKKLHITSTGKVRLKPGESAVIGYWVTVPGMNGMAIVTPETTSQGHVKIAAKLLQMSMKRSPTPMPRICSPNSSTSRTIAPSARSGSVSCKANSKALEVPTCSPCPPF